MTWCARQNGSTDGRAGRIVQDADGYVCERVGGLIISFH